MSKPSCTYYIKNNDLLGCYERYQNAYRNWKSHWWETVEQIYNASKEWCKLYVLDPINRTLTKIKDIIHTVKEKIKTRVPKEKPTNICYWVRLKGESGAIIFNKIGTTTREISKRMTEILYKQYKEGYEKITDYEILGSWDCRNTYPEGLESFFRSMLIKKYGGKNYIKNDRFLILDKYDEPTMEEMNKWALIYLDS